MNRSTINKLVKTGLKFNPKSPSTVFALLLVIAIAVIPIIITNLSTVDLKSITNTSTTGNVIGASTELYNVQKVVDGDTIDIDYKGSIKTIRLIGINTPETVDPRKPVECFGKEASNKAKELITGKKVRIESDPDNDALDKYGRMLDFIWLEDGTFINDKMVRDGYAYEYTYNNQYYKYQKQFREAQAEAKQNNRGLWNASTCNGQK